MDLIIVESPTKAATFKRFLKDKQFEIQATLGHIRDLPEDRLAIDFNNNFKPKYLILPKRKTVVEKIKELAKKARFIILATDADREGEAISYHVAWILGFVKENWPDSYLVNSSKLKRIIFHEITKEAIEKSLSEPRSLLFQLVNAQQARRILDRIVGYQLSPLLWKKIGKKWLSAGRVQTVALRFIVEREKEINNFKKEKYYKVEAIFFNKEKIKATLVSKNGKEFEEKLKMKLFDGEYVYTKTTIQEDDTQAIKKELLSDSYLISDVLVSTFKRYPPPPFITSSLQQEASRHLGFSSSFTMKLAQNLYERGFITYHRTDSVYLSPKFLFQARKFIKEKLGERYLLPKPRQYKTKSKLAQEAHEAIRPTNLFIDFNNEKSELTDAHKKLYLLILNRAVASQIKEAEFKKIVIKITGEKGYLFESEKEELIFDGFLKIYQNNKSFSKTIGEFKRGEKLKLKELNFLEKTTNPPPRYNEASLIKTLEEKGIGRPSTYAPIISTILERNYVEKKEGRFLPTILGTTVCDYLSKAFPDIFSIDFTAKMEEELDLIAQNQKSMIPVLKEFYFPFSEKLKKCEEDKEYINVEEKIEEKCPRCQSNLVIRYSRYGRFYACSKYPECKFTKPYYEKVAGKKCPKCQGEIIIKLSRKGKRFYACINYPQCNFAAWRLNEI